MYYNLLFFSDCSHYFQEFENHRKKKIERKNKCAFNYLSF